VTPDSSAGVPCFNCTLRHGVRRVGRDRIGPKKEEEKVVDFQATFHKKREQKAPSKAADTQRNTIDTKNFTLLRAFDAHPVEVGSIELIDDDDDDDDDDVNYARKPALIGPR
jgi:hypothetical protein